MALFSSLPKEAKALLDTIAGTESPGYNVLYSPGKKLRRFKDYSAHPNDPAIIPSGPNKGKPSSAAGRYQFIVGTWNKAAKALGLKDFSPASQDKAAWWLAQRDYKKITGRDLLTDLKDPARLPKIAKALSPTWTSLPSGIEATTNTDRFVAEYNRYLTNPIPPTAIPGYVPSGPKTKAQIQNERVLNADAAIEQAIGRRIEGTAIASRILPTPLPPAPSNPNYVQLPAPKPLTAADGAKIDFGTGISTTTVPSVKNAPTPMPGRPLELYGSVPKALKPAIKEAAPKPVEEKKKLVNVNGKMVLPGIHKIGGREVMIVDDGTGKGIVKKPDTPWYLREATEGTLLGKIVKSQVDQAIVGAADGAGKAVSAAASATGQALGGAGAQVQQAAAGAGSALMGGLSGLAGFFNNATPKTAVATEKAVVPSGAARNQAKAETLFEQSVQNLSMTQAQAKAAKPTTTAPPPTAATQAVANVTKPKVAVPVATLRNAERAEAGMGAIPPATQTASAQQILTIADQVIADMAQSHPAAGNLLNPAPVTGAAAATATTPAATSTATPAATATPKATTTTSSSSSSAKKAAPAPKVMVSGSSTKRQYEVGSTVTSTKGVKYKVTDGGGGVAKFVRI